jgi:type I restriction enzyme M protein
MLGQVKYLKKEKNHLLKLLLVGEIMFETTIKKIRQIVWVEGQNDDSIKFIGQLSWLLFLRYLDSIESDREDKAVIDSKKYVPILDEKYRWDSWACPKNSSGVIDDVKCMTGQDLIDFVVKNLFPYLKKLKSEKNKGSIKFQIASVFENFDNGFESGYILRRALNEIDNLKFDSSDERDELGGLYENELKNLGNKGSGKGEFYTPRPLIRAMISVIKPKIGETVYDGACGTCGFLYESYKFMKRDNISVQDLKTLNEDTLYGQELKAHGYLFGVMNMILHGIANPNIIRTNTLSKSLSAITEDDRHDVILMNPPFGSGVASNEQNNFDFKSSEMAYLFMQHIIKKIKAGGRAAVIIKNTFLSNGDAKNIRKLLLEKCKVHTILNMPKGSFLGAGVKTVVLFFEKGRPTKKIWYYDLDPGRSLGKTNPLNDNDLKEFIELQKSKLTNEKSWIVDGAEILKSDEIDLSVKNPNTPEEAPLRSPEEIFTEMEALDSETKDLMGSIKDLI